MAKSELLDSWTWNQIRKILESLPSSLLEDTDSTLLQKPRFSLSSVLDTSNNQNDIDDKNNPTSALRPLYNRLQSPSLVAGRVATRPEPSTTIDGVQHQRLDPQNICIVGTRRAGGGDIGRIMLDLGTNSSTLAYSLYTGQPVVLKATNLNGRCLTAFEFYQVMLVICSLTFAFSVSLFVDFCPLLAEGAPSL